MKFFKRLAFIIITSTFVTKPSSAALIDYWSGNGTFVDAIRGNNATTTFGNVTYASGFLGDAFLFNGSSQLSAPSLNMPINNQSRTLDLWFNLSQQSTHESYLAGYGSASATNLFALGLLANGQPFFSQWGAAIFAPQITTGLWHNLAVTFDGTITSLYLDGLLAGSGNLPVDTTSGAFLFGYLDPNRNFNGLMEQIRLYDTALTAEQIRSVMDADIQRASVTEPMTFSLIGLGAVGMNIARNRKSLKSVA